MVEVSVIIPCFNDGAYLQEAVDSVRNQTFKNWEIIIVDDGSTDPLTLQKLKAYESETPQIKVFRIQNQGPSVARNFGIEKASGQYILPLDADDKIHSEYLAKAVAFLKGNSNFQIFYSRARYFGIVDADWNLPQFQMLDFAFENCIYVSAVFPKTLWEKVGGYNPNMANGLEDYDFWIKAIQHGYRPYRDDNEMFFYRVKSGSRSVHASRIESENKIYKTLITNNLEFFRNPEVIIEAHQRLRTANAELEVIRSSVAWKYFCQFLVRFENYLRLHKRSRAGLK